MIGDEKATKLTRNAFVSMEQKQRPSDRDVAEENDSITIPVQMINDI